MADGITLSASIRANLQSLQKTSGQLDTVSQRLSTGKKVNSALDDANAFFASQGLSNRANDLSGLLDGIGQGIQTLKAADDGISSLTDLVEQAQSIATTARDQAKPAASVTSTAIGDADADDLTGGSGTVVSANDVLTLQAGDDDAVDFTIDGSDINSLDDLAAAINGTDGFKAEVIKDADASEQQIKITTTNGGDLSISETGTAASGIGLTATSGTPIEAVSSPEDQATLEADYNKIRDQIDQLIQDTSYRGTNLLNGDSLSVQFNEDNSSKLDIEGVKFDADGLGIDEANFSSEANIQGDLDKLSGALNKLRAGARTFGNNLATMQTRQDFTENAINTLEEGSDKLTLADINEEGAKMLALQTSQSLGITSLSLSSQAQQGVLRLF